MSLEEIFDTILLDHYRHPRKQGKLDDFDFEMDGANPLCGDEIHLQVKVKQNHVHDVAFTGKSCAICTASTSMFCEQAVGSSFEDLVNQYNLVKHLLEGVQLTDEERKQLGDIIALKGVSKLPARVKCALLVWETWSLIHNAIKNQLRQTG